MSNLVIRFFDYIFVLRPTILIPAWSFFLLGAAGAGITPRPSAMSASLAALTMILISGYLLNQVFDRESDEKNNKCPHLSHNIFHARTLVVLALVFFIGASLTAQLVAGPARALLIGALALALIYSLPPIRLCSRPFLDLLANAVGYGAGAFTIGYLSVGGTLGAAVVAAVPYTILVGSTFLYTTILDREGDRAAGKISTTVLIGVRASYAGAVVLHVAAVVCTVVMSQPVAMIVAGASLPFALYALWRQTDGASKLAVQGNTLVVTIAAAVSSPLYLLVVVPLLLASRYYYRRRFGITYPGPGGDGETQTTPATESRPRPG